MYRLVRRCHSSPLTLTLTTLELMSLKRLDISFNNLVDLSLIGLQVRR